MSRDGGAWGRGHVLVLPRLDGDATPGWFVLDTASPGYAIDPAAADALGASSFGRLSVVGVGAAALAGKLRRGSSVGLGACVVSYPTYMGNALRAALNASVAGSVDGGTDRARRRPRDGFSATLRVGDSRAETRAGEPDPAAVRGVREKSTNVRCVPARGGVVATRDVDIRSAARAREGRRRRRRARAGRDARGRKPAPGDRDDKGGFDGRLFRLSLGAGGTGAIVSARAAAEWNMISRTVGLQPGACCPGRGGQESTRARGPGGGHGAIGAGGISRRDVRDGSSADARGRRSAGPRPIAALRRALCADLFRGCTVVLDLGRNRIAVTQGE